MFVVQETGDTFRVLRQAEASVKRPGRDTRDGERCAKNYHPSGASCALRPLRAVASKTVKKKKNPILQAARTVEQNWCTFFARK